jgi:Ca-activated chloride channel family protein
MAALQPPPTSLRDRVAVKLLVDCSGSMGGDSVASARAALHGALRSLGKGDEISLSRFGSTVEHAVAPTAFSADVLRHLKTQLDATDANLGGTEMAAALRQVFALPVHRDIGQADVLLVTDGEIWDVDELVRTAQRSGHRVFVIGVGSSPAENVLRLLADATGGACEFATPGESLEAAAARMLARIRQQPWRHARVDWGATPVWQTTLPKSIFAGDTVIAFAGMGPGSAAGLARLYAANARGSLVELACTASDATIGGDALPRMGAAARLAGLDDALASRLALDYSLLCEHTNCILVHRRADADKVAEGAQLHRLQSMLAAGWGGTGIVACATTDLAPSLCRSQAVYLPDPQQIAPSSEANATRTLEEMARAVMAHIELTGTPAGVAAYCEALGVGHELAQALGQLRACGLSDDEAWIVFAHWMNVRMGGMGDVHVTATLAAHLSALPMHALLAATQGLDGWFRGSKIPAAGAMRTERLRRAMVRQ